MGAHMLWTPYPGRSSTSLGQDDHIGPGARLPILQVGKLRLKAYLLPCAGSHGSYRKLGKSRLLAEVASSAPSQAVSRHAVLSLGASQGRALTPCGWTFRCCFSLSQSLAGNALCCVSFHMLTAAHPHSGVLIVFPVGFLPGLKLLLNSRPVFL